MTCVHVKTKLKLMQAVFVVRTQMLSGQHTKNLIVISLCVSVSLYLSIFQTPAQDLETEVNPLTFSAVSIQLVSVVVLQ